LLQTTAKIHAASLVVEHYCQIEGCSNIGTNVHTISLFAEETIVAMIFTHCDTEGTGNVPVLKLINFMLSNADQKLDRWVNGQNVWYNHYNKANS
jgi:hypothetical protein